jgi:DNA (cytosine-5)-methyltransferase 1
MRRDVQALFDRRRPQRELFEDDLVGDLFAGGGGASTGLEAALGRPVNFAINHSAVALETHKRNHPETLHLEANIWEVRPRDVTRGRGVWILWASPDCTHFSVAKGGKPRQQNIRSLADAVVVWAREVRPRIIFLENVAEFLGWGPLDGDGQPIKARMGEEFARWKGELEQLGYAVDHRILNAAHYGAPTKRRRLFLVARCDGEPISWPLATHGPGLLPYRTAAECIDWSISCPSIFERKRPLAEKTLRRIALGIRRFVLENPRPFIVGVGGRAGQSHPTSITDPIGTITAKNDRALVAPTLIQTSYGEREGQRPRYLNLHEPLGTVVAQGQKHALVAAFLAKHFGGVVGQPIDTPASTITARDHHGLTTAILLKLRGECAGADLHEPMPTITAGGTHIAQVRAFLTAFYGQDGTGGQLPSEPLRTIPAKHRFGLVTVDGADYQIADIGMRMLEPPELLRAQFGRYAGHYDLSAARTKADQIRLIGNSVCPEVAEALVTANVRDTIRRRAA